MWPVYDGPRPPKLATDLYTRGREKFLRRTVSLDSADASSEFIKALSDGAINGYLDPRLLRAPVHSLRRVAHEMHRPFRAYGVQPFPSLAAVEQKTRAAVDHVFKSGDAMEQDLKVWMSQKGISLAQRSPGLRVKRVPSPKTKQQPYERGTFASADVLGPRGIRKLLSPPIASPEYLKRELQMDGMHMPRAMTSKIGMKECKLRHFLSMKVRVSEQFDEIFNPVGDETCSLSQLAGLSKLQIEEMRRRWWRETPGGLNDFQAFIRLMKLCRACAGFTGETQLRETMNDIFEFLDVDCDRKIDFEEFIRACGVFVVASEPLDPSLLLNYSHVDHLSKGQLDFLENPRLPGDRMSRRDLQRTNMRVQLAKLFYSDMTLDRELRRCVAVQVSRMMTMLLGDREFKSQEDVPRA